MKKLMPTFFLMALASTILSYAMLSSTIVKADNVVDDINIIVPESCTMSGEGMNSHTQDIPNGQYYPGIGTTYLRVYCNDNGGFAIYAIGFTGDQYTGADHTKLIGTATNQKIVTGTATTTGNPDVSNWAMKLATDGTATYAVTLDNGYGAYSVVPDTYTKVAHRDNATDVGTNAVGAELTTTYAAYVAKNQPADTYIGQVKYTLVHPSTETPLGPQVTQAGKICYYPNGGNVVGTMGCQTVSTSATSATLLASNFSREGYGFAGWSTTFDYSDSTGFLGPQEYIEFAAGTYTGSNPGLSLYARWIKSAGNLQNWTCPNNTNMPIGTVTALTDLRDNETYAVAKLADGNCWMIENLRLEADYTTRNGDEALAQGYGHSTTYGSFTGLATAESANFTDTNPPVANSLYSTNGTTTNTIQGGSSSYYYVRMPRYNNTNTSTRATNNPNANTSAMYSYGNYYTWSAAMANIKQYTSPTSTDDEGKTSETANTSLCPTGWRLPKGGDKTRITSNNDNEFWNLTVVGLNGGTLPANYGSQTRPYYTGTAEAGPVANKLRAYPNNFLYSGLFNTSSATLRDSRGYYWSSTAYVSLSSYGLCLGSSIVSPGTDNNTKYYGSSVRCLLSPSV